MVTIKHLLLETTLHLHLQIGQRKNKVGKIGLVRLDTLRQYARVVTWATTGGGTIKNMVLAFLAHLTLHQTEHTC